MFVECSPCCAAVDDSRYEGLEPVRDPGLGIQEALEPTLLAEAAEANVAEAIEADKEAAKKEQAKLEPENLTWPKATARGSFTVKVSKSAGKLGVFLETEAPRCLIKCLTPGGLLDKHNTSCPVDQVVKIGDQLLKVNGKEGKPEKLFDILKEATGEVEMLINPRPEKKIVVKASEKLGVIVVTKDHLSALEVSEVKDASKGFRIGDYVVAVNSVARDSQLLFDEVRKTTEKELTVVSWA